MMGPRIVLCLAVLGLAVGQQQNTRIFGLGNLLGGITSSINRPTGGGFGGGGFGGGGFGGGNIGGGSSGCRYFCQTPQRQYYCCEQPGQSLGGGGGGFNSVKPGQCPPVRPQCPPTRGFRPPSQCSSDSRCPGREKCCYDTCLRHQTCKPPQGGFFG
ncbi:unnamed protein product [Meganyctiphanes norvegica]|uniref:WAP domain-containing protein n=1 Tax=Meganyctiphanes norvegica TaxID=48144 RepID=A0AAV2S7R5_MEGNR